MDMISINIDDLQNPGDLFYDCTKAEFYALGSKEGLLYRIGRNELDMSSTTDMHPRICSRCGAPLTGHKCEYCGTSYTSAL